MVAFEQFVPRRYGVEDGLPDRPVTRIHRADGTVSALVDGAYAFDGERWEPTDRSPFVGTSEPPPDVDLPARYPVGSPIPDTDDGEQAEIEAVCRAVTDRILEDDYTVGQNY